jgi:hypothetical protein
MPEPKYERFRFPKNAYVGNVTRPYETLGPVRSKVDFANLDLQREDKEVCHNYYNKSVRELARFAKLQGGDAVIDVKSVVFLQDGRSETHPTPECSDDGAEGQVLTQGIAVKWKAEGTGAGSWTEPKTVPEDKPVLSEPAPSVAPAVPRFGDPRVAPGVQ